MHARLPVRAGTAACVRGLADGWLTVWMPFSSLFLFVFLPVVVHVLVWRLCSPCQCSGVPWAVVVVGVAGGEGV